MLNKEYNQNTYLDLFRHFSRYYYIQNLSYCSRSRMLEDKKTKALLYIVVITTVQQRPAKIR